MEQDKSISQLGRASSIDGTELLVYAKGTTNGSMTVNQVAKLTEDKMLSGASLGVPDGTEALPAKRGDSEGTLKARAVSELHFRKYWQASGGTIDDAGHPTAPYGLNRLWLTYEEAVLIAAESMVRATPITGRVMEGRTNFEPLYTGGSLEFSNFRAENAEVLRLHSAPFKTYPTRFINWLFNAPELKSIIGDFDLTYFTGVTTSSFGCPLLEDVHFKSLKSNLDIRHLKSISLASLTYLVNNAANGSTAITVTVHAEVYAKLTDEAQADWFALLTSATAKNISFATVE